MSSVNIPLLIEKIRAHCTVENPSLVNYYELRSMALVAAQELEWLQAKQTPKACEHKATLYNALTCPSCMNVVRSREKIGNTCINVIPNECPYCRQRLKKPVEDEKC